jgi:hypothetical protein
LDSEGSLLEIIGTGNITQSESWSEPGGTDASIDTVYSGSAGAYSQASFGASQFDIVGGQVKLIVTGSGNGSKGVSATFAIVGSGIEYRKQVNIGTGGSFSADTTLILDPGLYIFGAGTQDLTTDPNSNTGGSISVRIIFVPL